MSAAPNPAAGGRAELVEVRDALQMEVLPAIDALHVLARYAGALREVEAVVLSEPSLGKRLRMGGVDVAELLDHQPEDRIAELAWAIRLRAQQLAESGGRGDE